MTSSYFLIYVFKVEQQENDGYVGEQLNIRLFEKIQEIEAKRKKEQKQETKRGSKKGKGEQKNQPAPGAAGAANKKSRGTTSLVDEERAIHEAYQVLLTEHHKRRAKRKRRALQNIKKEANVQQDNAIEDAFSHIRRKSNSTLLLK